jgi:pyruvate dehydrogenase E1 component beta subunit
MMRELSIREALNEALDEEMTRDDRVFLMGEEVGYYDGAYKVSRGLLQKYGDTRIIDTPISENGFAGVGVGAAMAGLRPVIEFMTWNFSLIAIDQIINSAAKVLYMSNGELDCPVVFRGPSGSVHQLAAQHSQSFESLYANCPGLKVIAPSNSYDAKGLLKSAIRDPDPVVFMESEAMYGVRGEVPEEEYLIPIGKADIKRSGSDVTLVCWGKTVPTSLQAAEELSQEGISVEVIDLRTLRPFDEETVFSSVKKTNRVLICEEAWPVASFGSWVSSKISSDLFDYLDAPPLVHSGLDCPYPYAKNLEYYMRPRPETVIEYIKKLL